MDRQGDAGLGRGGRCPHHVATDADERREVPREERYGRRQERLASWPAAVAWTAPIVEVLRPGDELRIGWRFAQADPAFAGVDEWEAYLSLDGGRSYFLRLTPDMRPDVREVVWRVPDLRADDVRLFLHMGGRDFEKSMELPARLRFLGSEAPARQVASRALHEGEAPYRPLLGDVAPRLSGSLAFGVPGRPGEPGLDFALARTFLAQLKSGKFAWNTPPLALSALDPSLELAVLDADSQERTFRPRARLKLQGRQNE